MVDLKQQYHKIKQDIDSAVLSSIENADFINGSQVQLFTTKLQNYLNVKHVIPCANGTDSLQIAMMALGLKAGDEVICPAFTYVATAEVICLLGLIPVMVDVNSDTFNILVENIEKVITPKTKAIVPVHLFGQSCEMETIMKIAKKHNLFVIEDNAQSLGANYTFSNGDVTKTGTIGDIGSTSFFPSKNLGCYGDGGALYTNDDQLAAKIKMIANHGQEIKYVHKVIGCNSRLDNLQAAILNVKLDKLDEYLNARNEVANYYLGNLKNINEIELPNKISNSTHAFHQFTIKVSNNKRDSLQKYLQERNIPSMIYYPIPLYKQEAYSVYVKKEFELKNTENLCKSVLSLPMHTEMDLDQLEYICKQINLFFNA